MLILFQSTSSIQRKTNVCPIWRACTCISIHFLYTEEDIKDISTCFISCISIHFLYTEEDRITGSRLIGLIFQSTSSIQRKTITEDSRRYLILFQSTSSIQRKTIAPYADRRCFRFQSTSSIQRKTILSLCIFHIIVYFNPLPLYRGRRKGGLPEAPGESISIHFLYTEEDVPVHPPLYGLWHFNPLPLYRGRLLSPFRWVFLWVFQSTSSIQRKTRSHGGIAREWPFQSTSSIQRKTEA